MSGGKYYRCWVVVFVLWFASATPAQRPAGVPTGGVEELAQALLKAKTDEERRALLAAKKELVTARLRTTVFAEGNVFLAEGKYAQAGDAYRIAQHIAEQLSDRQGAASALLNIGTVQYLQGDYDRALESYGQARAVFQELNERAETARALMGIGFVRKEQGKSGEAIESLRQALAHLEALRAANGSGEVPSVLKGEMTDLLNTMGSIYYDLGDYNAATKTFQQSLALREDAGNMLSVANAFYYQGNYPSALEYYRKALVEFEKQKNSGALISTLGSMANAYYSLGSYDLAAEFYLRNLPLLEKLNDKAGVAATQEGLGNVYRFQGDLGRALESYQRSLKSAEESGGKINTATLLGSIGIVLSSQGDTAQALEYYQKSLTQFRATGDKASMARMLVNIGNTYYMQGSYAQTLESFQQALAVREAIGDNVGVAQILLGMGTTYDAQGNYAQALQSHQKALVLFETAGEKEGMASALRRLAASYALQTDYAQALSAAERAVALAAQVNSLDLLWRVHLEAGKYHLAQNRAAQARRSFEESIKTLERSQTQPITGERDFSPADNSVSPYAEMAGILAEQDRAAEAFAFSERAKAHALRSLLERHELKITKSLTPQEREEERNSISELVSIQSQIRRARQRRQSDEPLLAGLNDRLRQAQNQYQALRAKFYAAHPQLKVFRGELPPPGRLEDAASLLPDAKSAFVEYVVTEGKVYLFVLTRAQESAPPPAATAASAQTREPAFTLKAYALNTPRKGLVERVVHFRQMIMRREADIAPLARELYDLLLKPAEEQLTGRTSIIIAPDAVLWTLPFQALQPAENQYLIERSAVSYVPSLTAWREMARARKDAPKRVTAVAAPVLVAFGNPTPHEEILSRARLTSRDEKIEPLPQTASEVQSLKPIYGTAQSKIYVGAEASEERLAAIVGGAGVMHFAAHAVLNDVNPMYSFVMLASGDPNRREDGLLHVWEVMHLRSEADLVVYSASSTVQTQAGNGAVGLMWAWFVAGSPTTVASDWRVVAPATSELMNAFHRNLHRKNPALKTQPDKAESLRQAVLGLLPQSEYRHPFYWAGFRILGDVK